MKTSRRSLLHGTVAFVLALLFVSPLISAARVSTDDTLLETGSATRIMSVTPAAPADFKVVSYNMRWRGGDDLRRLIKLLKDDEEIGGATIIGLQEVDRNKKRTNGTNTARVMAEDLKMHYAWAAPPPAKPGQRKEEETGVAILSSYPLTEVARIVLPNEGPGGRRRVAIGATVNFGAQTLRVYSVHAETRISNEERLEQFKAVIDDFQTFKSKVSAAIVMGDFNTLFGKDVNATTELFTHSGFHTPFPDDESTWKTFIIELKLDWIWLKGLEVKKYGINRDIKLSDHWPLWTIVRLNQNKK